MKGVVILEGEPADETTDGRAEAVDHPAHYGGADNAYEAIKVIESLRWGPDFCRGNALKYLMRAGKKGDEREDLEKAIWYIRRRIEQIDSERAERE